MYKGNIGAAHSVPWRYRGGTVLPTALYQDMVIWCSCCCSLVKCGRPAGGIAAAIIAGPIGVGVGSGIGIGAAPPSNMLHTIGLTVVQQGL